jgi:hypothetical protein
MEYSFDEFVKLDCNHKYCKRCLQHTFKVKIEEKKVRKIICPCDKCEEEVTFHKMKEILEKEMFEKYDIALLEDTFVNEDEFIYCPVPDCGNPICGMKEHPKIICRKCDQKICFNCKTVGWHKGKCEMKQDEGVKKWMKENNAKPCPNCSVPIEKNKGCDHVYCINCKHHFLWSKPEAEYIGAKYIPATETQWNAMAARWDADQPAVVAPVVGLPLQAEIDNDALNALLARVGLPPLPLPQPPLVGDFVARQRQRRVQREERRVQREAQRIQREARRIQFEAQQRQRGQHMVEYQRQHREQARQRMQRQVADQGGIAQGVVVNRGWGETYDFNIQCTHCNRAYPEKGWRTHCRTQKHQRNRGAH